MGSIDERKHGLATADDMAILSEVIGEGTDARREVRVGTWTLTSWFAVGAHEPLMHDLDLGERLLYARPRKIREVIARLDEEGHLPGISKRPTTGRYELRPGVMHPGQSTHEYWLTEAEALLVSAKSETPPATALLTDMIRVYMLARRGLLPRQQEVAELARQVEELQAKVDALKDLKKTVEGLETTVESTLTQVYTSGSEAPFIGTDAAKLYVRGPLLLAVRMKYAALGISYDKKDEQPLKIKKHRARLRIYKLHEDQLRRNVEFLRDSGPWAQFPNSRLHEIILALKVLTHHIRTENKIALEFRTHQLVLPGVDDRARRPIAQA